MSNQTNNNNQQNNQSVSENIKDSAGAAFHSVHSALAATENVAMNAVDATANAVTNLTGNNNNRNQE